MNYRIHPAAQHEADEAADWYGERVPALAVEFARQYVMLIDTILESPRMFPPADDAPAGVECRNVTQLGRFPYRIVYALFGEALLPSPYRWPAGVGPARYRQHRQAVGRQENDPSPLNVFLRPVAIADDRSQSRAILLAQKNTDGLCHAPKIARLNANVNPMFVSLH